MNDMQRAMAEVDEEATPQLQIVESANGAMKKSALSAPLLFPSRSRPPRSELAVLGWHNRATRLANRK